MAMSSDPVGQQHLKVETLPLPPPPTQSEHSDCRLWIGNLDSKITEYAMLKLLQKFSNVTLKQFDFIYHRNGPDKGRPRGYCFVTFNTPQQAASVLYALNGKLALSRRLVVKYAEVEKRDIPASVSAQLVVPAADSKEPDFNVEGKIKAIEAKLQMMEDNKEGGTPPIVLFPPPANLKRQQELAAEAAESSSRRNRSEYKFRRPARPHRPYNKSRRGR